MSTFYKLAWPLVRRMDPETAHTMALKALSSGLLPRPCGVNDPVLQTTVLGLDFPNPIGLAAGFDKNAEVFGPMLDQGFGFVEVGSVTPKPQPGNDKPRLFRLEEDLAVINRMGFNNEGHAAMVGRLQGRDRARGIVGVNLGKNKTSEDAVADYVAGIEVFADLADYLVVNVSSPNTPGLRALQGRGELEGLLKGVLDARNAQKSQPPVLLKIAPDLTDEDKADIAAVALNSGVDGLIVTNTTIERADSLQSPHRGEGGGLSGQPLFEAATRVLKEMYELTEGKVVLVGAGGVSNAEQAYAKIRAGASLVQVYSALVYKGPHLAAAINSDLVGLLKRDGFKSVSEAVGK